MSPKKFMKTSFKSNVYSLFIMICFIFFGCMVKKKFIVEVCFFCLKYHQISIEIYQFFKFLAFWWKFLYRNLENRNQRDYVSKNFMRTSLKSTDNSLFVMICFIFFGCMIWKKFRVEVCIFYWKCHQISIEIHQNLKFLAFW